MSSKLWVCCLTCVAWLSSAVPMRSASSAGPASNVLLDIHVENPRSFGYVVGDTLERRVRVNAARNVELVDSSLPKLGRQDVWLTLIGTDVEPKAGARARSHTIRLTYQLRNAPTEPKRVTLPAVSLQFAVSTEVTLANIQEWSVTAGPINPASARADRTPLRPDRLPRPIPTTAAWLGLALSVGLALLIMGYRLYLPVLRQRNAPFARAYRAIRLNTHLSKVPHAQSYQEGLRAVHRALDDTVGWRVFPDRIDRFLAEKPQFADLRATMSRFLGLSRREFFGAGVPPEEQDLHWLLAFCRDCRTRERRLS